MSGVEYSDPEGILNQFKKYQDQLSGILQAYSANQDDALLSGFLTFAHSKCSKQFDEMLGQVGDDVRANKLENGAEDAQLIMDCLWKSVHYPIFKWFQLWRQHLVAVKVEQKPRFVELRKMNSKLTKFFKIIHKFYYGILDMLASRFELSEILPKPLLNQLNIQVSEGAPKQALRSDSGAAVTVVVLMHRSLLNIGCCHRYKSVCEKYKNIPHDLQHFQKSMRYFNLATLVLPSVGEPYLQEGLIYVQTKNFGLSTYSFARSALSRLPSTAGFSNFVNSICDPSSRIFTQVLDSFQDVCRQEREGRIANREIIETYFLVLFCSKFAPSLWSGEKGKCLLSEARLQFVKEQLYEKTATRYGKNLELILRNLILLIGGFDLLKTAYASNSDAKKVQSVALSYLTFTFDYISHFIQEVVLKELDNHQEWVYLAFIRVVECWLMVNKTALQFAHRNVKFCDVMMQLMNEIEKNPEMASDASDLGHRPKRPYYFEEDVLLREFKSLKYSLSDFKDDEFFGVGNASGAFVGMVNTKISKKEEHKLRMEAIRVSGKKFLAKNACGIQFLNGEFVKSAVKTKVGQAWSQKAKNMPKLATKKTMSMRELESRLQNDPAPSTWGYSGSSVPLAPASLKARPSTSFTERPVSKTTTSPSFTEQKAAPPGIIPPLTATPSPAPVPMATPSSAPAPAAPSVSTGGMALPAYGSITPTPTHAPAPQDPHVFYHPPGPGASHAVALNGQQMVYPSFETPIFPPGAQNGIPPMMTAPFAQYWPQAYQAIPYGSQAAPYKDMGASQSAQFAAHPGAAAFPAQSQVFMGNFSHPQY